MTARVLEAPNADVDLEQDAIRAEAELRVRELRRVAQALWPHRADEAVLAELLMILSGLRAAEHALKEAMR